MTGSATKPPVEDPYSAWRVPGFARYLTGNVVALIGVQMLNATIGWELFARTKNERDLGLIGLIEFLPVLFFSLLAGQLADRIDRRTIVVVCHVVLAATCAGLAAVSHWQLPVRWIFVLAGLVGLVRAFSQPAKASMMPLVVPDEQFRNAVTWNSTGFQLASVLGPALTGLLLAMVASPSLIYLIAAACASTFIIAVMSVRLRPQAISSRAPSLRTLAAGLAFVWRNKLILHAITLDLFAVLLGGATALLPVYAKDMLNMERDLGWLRHAFPAFLKADQWNVPAIGYGALVAAPAWGAVLMAVVMAHRPVQRRAGWTLLASVAVFGVSMIVFGLSRSFWVSLVALAVSGAVDMVSVIIRHTLIQTLTPDEMRGRVQAVNGIFIGASNELGRWESGEVAHWAKFIVAPDRDPEFAPTFSVVSGGVGTLLVVAALGTISPPLRNYEGSETADKSSSASSPSTGP